MRLPNPKPAFTPSRVLKSSDRPGWRRAAEAAIAAAMTRAALPICVFLAALFAGLPASAQIDNVPKVHASLVAETNEVAPGKTVTIALIEGIRPGWHTYWLNPGEAGEPTDIQWTLPAG